MSETTRYGFHVTVRHLSEAQCVVDVLGTLDLIAAPTLRAKLLALLDQGYSNLTINLTAAPYIDSSGLGVLVGIYRRVKERNGLLSVVAPHQGQRRVFQITRLDQIFPLYFTEAEITGPGVLPSP